ncbi:hypothetical protein TanjilG_04932 [Lupinus angustifolius]|uniref:F-box associated beta-propeller type 1 domain-containing protein n=1 Tax=Lupinus angustifolius TaxID=3871 RepID=A0A1J7IK61_LUPAN|nr:hypothetical protein TanjilG_04932 [Lupinus angustifolius]
MGDTCWRDIQNFPEFVVARTRGQVRSDGVCISNNLNWIVVSKCNSFRQFVIASLDLVEETFTQLSMPCGFDEVYLEVPIEELYVFLGVLMDCLCISYDDFNKGTNFVVWQMKEFGVQKSWTKLLNVSYHDLQLDCKLGKRGHRLSLFPLRMYKNGDFVITVVHYHHFEAIMYNQRDNRVKHFKTKSMNWIFETDYIESLVSPL